MNKKIISLILTVTMLVMTSIMMTGCSDDTFDLADYVSIRYNTSATNGNAKIREVEFDSEKAAKDFAEMCGITDEETITRLENKYFDDFGDNLSVDVDKNISNGDKIKVYWNFNYDKDNAENLNELRKTYDCEIKCEDFTITVKGLPDEK